MKSQIESNIFRQATLDILAKARAYSKQSPNAMADLNIIANDVFIETPWYTKDFQASAQKIIGAQKYVYDESTYAAVERTSALDIEEILGNLDKISFPFDRIWLVGRSPDNPKLISCFAIETDSENHSFQFRNFYYFDNREPSSKVIHHDEKGRNADYIALLGKSLATVDSKGIHFDEDALLRELEITREIIKEGIDKNPGIMNKDVLPLVEDILVKEIDSIQRNADFLARLFVVMGADRDFVHPTSKNTLGEELRLNRKRQSQKFPVKLISDFMEINLSLPNYKNKTPTQQQIRTLLGWTTVRRSKPIMRKNGEFFTRKPHDRRIAAAKDLRGRERGLTVGDASSALIPLPTRPIFTSSPPADQTPEND